MQLEIKVRDRHFLWRDLGRGVFKRFQRLEELRARTD